MLNVMRKHATGWVVKVLFGILIASFAIWGIGDVLRRPHLGGALVTVGGEPVQAREVTQQFDTLYQQLQQQMGGNLTRPQAVSYGVLNQALERVVAFRLVDAHARDLKITMGNDEIAAAVRANPMFQGGQGFDRARFDMFLRSQGSNEQAYLGTLRHDLVRQQIIQSLSAPVEAPAVLASRLLAYQDEERKGLALIVDADEIAVDKPDEAALKTYLDANAKKYEAPEYRGVTLVVAGPDDLADEIAIDDATLKAEYESRKEGYRTPETRSFDQLVAADEATIKEAAGMAAAGQDLAQIAAALKGKGVERTQLGPVRKGDLPEGLDKAVFDAAQDAVAEPVSSSFGWHLLKVTEIKPETVRSFADVHDDLERELKLQKAGEQLPALATKLDDEVAAGTALDQAAAKVGLKAERIEALDRQGQDPKQVAVAADRLTPEILGAVFTAGQGETSLLSQSKDGKYYMFRVDSIQAAHPRPLDEVRDVLASAWKKEQQAAKAKARAEELRGRITDAASLDQVAAAETGLTRREIGPLKRADQNQLYLAGLTPEALASMFSTPAGSVAPGTVPALEGSAVLLVTDVAGSQPEAAAVDKEREALANDMRSDVLQQYEAALRARYPVNVDQAQLAQMMQSDTP